MLLVQMLNITFGKRQFGLLTIFCLFIVLFSSAHTKSWILLVQMLKISKHLVKDASAYWRLFVCLFCLCSAYTKRILLVEMLKKFITFGKKQNIRTQVLNQGALKKLLGCHRFLNWHLFSCKSYLKMPSWYVIYVCYKSNELEKHWLKYKYFFEVRNER